MEKQEIYLPAEETPTTENAASAANETTKPSASTVRFAADMALGNKKITTEVHGLVVAGEMSLDEARRRVESGEVEVPQPEKKGKSKGATAPRKKSDDTFYSPGGQVAYRGAPNAVVIARKHVAVIGVKDDQPVLVNSAHVSPGKLVETAVREGIFSDATGVLIGRYDPETCALALTVDPTDAQRGLLTESYPTINRVASSEEKRAAKAAEKEAAKKAREEARAAKKAEKEETTTS